MSAETSPWTIGAVMSAGAVAVSWLIHAMTSGWKARGIVADMDKKIAEQATEIKDEMRLEHDEQSRAHGEAVTAVRQKLTDVELWNRDNFVRQRDFDATIASINRNFETLASDMKSSFRDLGAKIDKLQTRD